MDGQVGKEAAAAVVVVTLMADVDSWEVVAEVTCASTEDVEVELDVVVEGACASVVVEGACASVVEVVIVAVVVVVVDAGAEVDVVVEVSSSLEPGVVVTSAAPAVVAVVEDTTMVHSLGQ